MKKLFVAILFLLFSFSVSATYEVHLKNGKIIEYDQIEQIITGRFEYIKCFTGSESILWEQFKIEKIYQLDETQENKTLVFPGLPTTTPTPTPTITPKPTPTVTPTQYHESQSHYSKQEVTQQIQQLFDKDIVFMIFICSICIVWVLFLRLICMWWFGTGAIVKELRELRYDINRQNDPKWQPHESYSRLQSIILPFTAKFRPGLKAEDCSKKRETINKPEQTHDEKMPGM